MQDKTIFLIDSNSFCYRAYYAIRNLSTSQGFPTGAIYGFSTFLKRLLTEEKPDYLACCFDSKAKTFREEKFPEYKAHRPPMPDDLKVQIEKIKEVIAAFRIKSFELAGFEADDIIATLAKTFDKPGYKVYIVTSDKDMLQLVNQRINIYNPLKKPVEIIDEIKVKEKFGVTSVQIIDYLALAGDATDNIPGVRGIGDKTAVKLITDFGSVDNLLKKSARIESDSVRMKIEEQKQNMLLSRELATLDQKVPVKVSLEDIQVKKPDESKLFELFKEFEFKSLLKNLAPQAQNESELSQRQEIELNILLDAVLQEKELLLYLNTNSNDLYLASPKHFSKVSKINKQVKEILADPNIKKISDDLKAIKVFLFGQGIDLAGLNLDLKIAFYLIDSGRSDYSLEALSFDYFKRIADRETITPNQAFGLIDELRFVEQDLKRKNLDKLFSDIEMPLLEVLADLEISGVKIDTELLKDFSVKLDKQLKKLTQDIFKLAKREFNINSPKQLSQVLFEELKLPIKKRRKSHPSTDEAVLRILAIDYPICDHLLEFRQLKKLKDTYIDVLPTLIDKQDKIHTSFNQTVTQTGRLSSSNPNLQNIPIKTDMGAQVRRAFIPSKKSGFLLSADYSQIELRILAHLSGEKNLIEAFTNNLDIHSHTASLVFDLKEADVDEALRNMAKRVNFGIIYGISPFGLARDLRISQEEANEFIENYFLRYPKVKEFMQSCIESARKDGFVSTIMERRRYLPEINSKNMHLRSFAERQAINMPVQGSAADLIKKAMLDIYREFKTQNFSSKMVLQVHDELVFDCDKDELEQIIPLVKDKMENAVKLRVAVKVDMKQGKNWLETESV
jgi:DNA polymerase-1